MGLKKKIHPFFGQNCINFNFDVFKCHLYMIELFKICIYNLVTACAVNPIWETVNIFLWTFLNFGKPLGLLILQATVNSLQH